METISSLTSVTVRPVGHGKVTARITLGERHHDVWYEVIDGEVDGAANAWLAATLFPAMTCGGTLQLKGSLDEQLWTSASTIQDIFRAWYPDFHAVAVQSNVSRGPASTARGIGCFFSSGVDSFYSLLKHRPKITHLIFVHGFDIRLDDTDLSARASQAVHQIARHFGKAVIEVRTNLREFSDPYARWGEHYFGAALASVALCLSRMLKTVYLPSSHTYRHLHPWGSHPLLDPLWSTAGLQIIHDGSEATRFEKVTRLASCEAALRSLRVCWENREGAYNCGRCEKCLRTMVSLRLAGVLDRCATFERPLDVGLLSRIKATDETARFFAEQNLKAAERSGNDLILIRALRDSLSGLYDRGVWGWPKRALRRVQRLLA